MAGGEPRQAAPDLEERVAALEAALTFACTVPPPRPLTEAETARLKQQLAEVTQRPFPQARPAVPPAAGIVKAFWRWLTRPSISIADALLIATATIASDAIKLGWHLPWPADLAIVWGTLCGAALLIGFVKGFGRSALADYRRSRTGRDR